VGAPFAVGDQAVLALEPLGALDAVELAQAGEILGGLGALVLLKVFGGQEICRNLIQVSAGRLGML
jgi:hypothetical protein